MERWSSRSGLLPKRFVVSFAEIPGHTTRKTTTQKLPDLQNHIEAKPPFSASNYKKVTLRPVHMTTSEEEQSKYPQKIFKPNYAKPTKTSVDHILKQAAGSRQTHLIRADSSSEEEQEEQDLMRDMFGNSGQSLAPVCGLRVICWVGAAAASVIIILG